VRSVSWDPEGTYVAGTMADGSLCVFEAATGKLQARKRVVRKVRLSLCVLTTCSAGLRQRRGTSGWGTGGARAGAVGRRFWARVGSSA